MSGARVSTGQETRAPSRAARWCADVFWATDVGLGRLRSASQAVLTMMAAMAAQWLFIHATGALQMTAPPDASAAVAARVGFYDHATLLIGLLIAIMIGMMSGFAGPQANTPKEALVVFAWLPVPLVACMVLGSLVGEFHILTLVMLVVVLSAGTYARRFGHLGFLGGVLGFMGYFLGFFLRQHAGITPADLGWLTAEVVVAVLTAMLVQFTVFFPRPALAARRALRSYAARAALTLRAARRRYEAAPSERSAATRRLDRHADLAGAAALITDVRAGALVRVPAGWPDPATVRERLLAHEQALVAVVHAAQTEDAATASRVTRRLVHEALDAAVQRDQEALRRTTRVLAAQHELPRTTAALRRLTAASRPPAQTRAPAAQTRAPAAPAAAHPSPVTLFSGWLPGATLVSRAASAQPSSRRSDARLSPHTRAALQMAAAGTAAIIVGSAVSGYRFYWAALAAFFVLVGTNNTGEQVRKAAYRVVGTLAGVILAVPIVRAAGDHPWPVIGVVLASLFLGLYLIRVNYTLMLTGITVAIAELYVEFDEFTDHLLFLRLVETAIGAAAAALAVLVILPLRPTRVARTAAERYTTALEALADDDGSTVDAQRRADAAYQELLATAGARNTPYGPLIGARDAERRRLLQLARQTRRAAGEAAGDPPHVR